MPELEGFSDSLNKGLDGIDFTLPAEELRVAIAELANGTAGASAQGLMNKNSELLQKNTAINGKSEKMKELELYHEASELEKVELGKDYEAGKALYQTNADKKITAANEEMDELKGQLRELLVNDKVSSELLTLDVSKELMPMVQASIASLATITDGKAMVGDKTLSEYIVEWAETPAGKAVRVAPANSGGDGQGSNNTSNPPASDKPWAELTVKEKTARLGQNK